MNEKLISFETAKLSKEKGCKLKGDYLYIGNKNINLIPNIGTNNEIYYQALTQSLLQKWLRKIHNIIVWVSYTKENDYPYMDCIVDLKQTNRLTNGFRKTYEEALERGLQKALNLI